MAFSFNMGSLTGTGTKTTSTDPDDLPTSAVAEVVTTPTTTRTATATTPTTYASTTTTVMSDVVSNGEGIVEYDECGNPFSSQTQPISVSNTYVSPTSKTALVSPVTVGKTTLSSIPSIFSTKVTTGGTNVPAYSPQSTILQGIAVMNTQGILSDTQASNSESSESLDAEEFTHSVETVEASLQTVTLFAALGCTVTDNPDADYSLLTAQTNQQHSFNPNISNVTELPDPRPPGEADLSTQDSFTSQDDSFYDPLADTAPSTTQDATSAINHIVSIGSKATLLGADLVSLNMDKTSGTTLLQFSANETTKTTTSSEFTANKVGGLLKNIEGECS